MENGDGNLSFSRWVANNRKDAFLVGSYLYPRSTIACLSMNRHGVRKSSQ